MSGPALFAAPALQARLGDEGVYVVHRRCPGSIGIPGAGGVWSVGPYD